MDFIFYMEFISEQHFQKDLDICKEKMLDAIVELYSKYPKNSFQFNSIKDVRTGEYYTAYFTPIIVGNMPELNVTLNGNYFK